MFSLIEHKSDANVVQVGWNSKRTSMKLNMKTNEHIWKCKMTIWSLSAGYEISWYCMLWLQCSLLSPVWTSCSTCIPQTACVLSVGQMYVWFTNCRLLHRHYSVFYKHTYAAACCVKLDQHNLSSFVIAVCALMQYSDGVWKSLTPTSCENAYVMFFLIRHRSPKCIM